MAKEAILESAIMELLWSSERAMTPGEVRDTLGESREIAYTTVLTVMSRLWKKGLLERERHGRSYTYSPREDKEERTARRMEEMLAATRERRLTLARFLNNLSASDRKDLRRLLEDE